MAVVEIRYPVKREALREIRELILRSRAARERMETLKPVYVSMRFYESLRAKKLKKKVILNK